MLLKQDEVRLGHIDEIQTYLRMISALEKLHVYVYQLSDLREYETIFTSVRKCEDYEKNRLDLPICLVLVCSNFQNTARVWHTHIWNYDYSGVDTNIEGDAYPLAAELTPARST
jgi:hypothetical protein